MHGGHGSQSCSIPASSNPRHDRGQALKHRSNGGLLPLAEWDRDRTYDEQPPSCLRYTIEWKVTLNKKTIAKDTEQDVVLAPAPYWQNILQPRLEQLLQKKVYPSRCVRSDDTSVVVAVNERSERDLTKRFDETKIDWSVVEKRLVGWSDLFRAGKRLRVHLSFNYVETVSTSADLATKKGGQKGSSSTQRMLGERAAQLDAEAESMGQPSVWRDVYSTMRCPGPPCPLGPHCWRDPIGKRHYRLRAHHLRQLIKYVEDGGILHTHDDIPDDVRQQLYAEEQQKANIKHVDRASTPSNLPPIHITNVMPGGFDQPLPPFSQGGTPAPTESTCMASGEELKVPGLRDVAVKDYSGWQQQHVSDEGLKAEFEKACDVVLADGLDLEQIYEDQDPEFLSDRGVKRGIARRFVRDIPTWVKRYKWALP